MPFGLSSMVRNGEEETRFDSLYKMYFGFVYGIAYRILQDTGLAEDAAQETFICLAKSLSSLQIQDKKGLKSFLGLMAHNRSVDLLRKWERGQFEYIYDKRDIPENNWQELENHVLNRYNLQKAAEVIASMPKSYSVPLVLRVQGYSIKEISSLTGSSETNVKTRIFRARKMLAKALTE